MKTLNKMTDELLETLNKMTDELLETINKDPMEYLGREIDDIEKPPTQDELDTQESDDYDLATCHTV